MPRDAVVMKIQRELYLDWNRSSGWEESWELCYPKCARKGSGLSRNGPQELIGSRKKPISGNPTYKMRAILKKHFYTLLPRKTPIIPSNSNPIEQPDGDDHWPVSATSRKTAIISRKLGNRAFLRSTLPWRIRRCSHAMLHPIWLRYFPYT